LLEAWKDVFGIEERYKAKLCGHNEGKAWLVQIIDEAANVLMTPAEMLAAKRKTIGEIRRSDSCVVGERQLPTSRLRAQILPVGP
jgi:hypothetical protein